MSLAAIASWAGGTETGAIASSTRSGMVTMQGLALVDFDNFRIDRDGTRNSLEKDAFELLDEIPRVFLEAFPAASEVDIRLYGGWTNEQGHRDRDALWLVELLPSLRGRRHGVVVRPALATTMIQFPNVTLRGTVRGSSKQRRQKMVDGMIGSDAIFVAEGGSVPLSIASDDDDLVPAALSVYAKSKRGFAWMRRREVGSGLNDDALLRQGLRIYKV